MMTLQKAIESGNWPKQKRVYSPFFGGSTLLRVTNVLCSDGKFRSFEAVGEPDTFFTQPGRVKVNGVTVSGFIWVDTLFPLSVTETIMKFTAYSYRKNGSMLPEWGKDA